MNLSITSTEFIFLLPIAAAIYYIVPRASRKYFLLLINILFYASFGWQYTFVLIAGSVIAWCSVTPEAQRYFNYIGEVAAECGVPFLNGCNYFEEMGYDCMTDTCGDSGHLNHSGVTKFTTFVDEYLAENYDLPDRRDDSFYTELFKEADIWLEEALKE